MVGLLRIGTSGRVGSLQVNRMVSRGRRREREAGKRGITIGRRVGKIGFMGRGIGPPSREKPDVIHALSLRIDEDLIVDSERERERCRHDRMPLRGLLRRSFSRRPLAVVYPDSAQCVADILDVCIEERTPAVPRGLGSVGLGGATSLRGGVVIDLSRMDRVVMVDKETCRVTVEPGCTWDRLRDTLSSEDLSLQSYPSNSGGGTVGGWLSSGGYGVGTLAGGRFDAIVDSLEVAVPSGLLVSAGHGGGRYSIESFTGTEGQMGIVTGLTFSLKRKPEHRAYYVVGPVGMEAAEGALRDLARLDVPPFGLRLLSGRLPELRQDTGRSNEGGVLLALLFEGNGSAAEAFKRRLDEMSKRIGAELRRGEDARRIFESRFTDSRDSEGKTVARSGEALVGIDRLSRFLKVLRGEVGNDILLDCQVVARDLVLVMTCYIIEGGNLPPVVRDVPLTVRNALAALRCGGRPYGLGIWNSPFSGSILGGERRNLHAIKKDTDRLSILNPGKFFSLTTAGGLPVWGWSYRIGLRMLGAFGEGGVR